MLLGATSGMFETSFNNYLLETFNISAASRGVLEFPRELPGFLVAILSGLLCFLAESRMAVLAALATALGLLGLGWISPGYGSMMVWMVIWSIGTHLYMPLGDSLAVAVSPKESVGRTMGLIGGANTLAIIAGCAIVWLGIDYVDIGFSTIFTLGAVTAIGAALVLSLMDPRLTRPLGTRKKAKTFEFVFKKRYSLFYWLNVLFGARKQVFITFGPWVLIKIFGQPASIIAQLWIVSSILGIVFRPMLGRMVDSLGERFVLRMEAVVLILVCAGYGLANKLNLGDYTTLLLYVCFVGDQLMFSVGMARTTYLSKIIECQEDLMPSLSMGVSINHIVSMLIPSLGGWVWVSYGYEWVFVGAAIVALINYVVAGYVRIPRDAPEPTLIDNTEPAGMSQ